MSDDSTPGTPRTPTQLEYGSTPPDFSVSCDIGVSDTRLASSGRCYVDPARAAAIERFLLGGHTGAQHPFGGGLATSVASTLAPGGECIRGPKSAVDNMSFTSKTQESAAVNPSKAIEKEKTTNLPLVEKVGGDSVELPRGREVVKSVDKPDTAVKQVKEAKGLRPDTSSRGLSSASRGGARLVISSPDQSDGVGLEDSPPSLHPGRPASVQPRRTRTPKSRSVGWSGGAAREIEEPLSGARKLKRTQSLGDISQLRCRSKGGAGVAEWLAECSSFKKPLKSPMSSSGISNHPYHGGPMEGAAQGFFGARSEHGVRIRGRPTVAAYDRFRRGEEPGRMDTQYDFPLGPDRGKNTWQHGVPSRSRTSDNRPYMHVGVYQQPSQQSGAGGLLYRAGGVRLAERGMENFGSGHSCGSPSVHGAMSDQFVGQHLRVRATSLSRASRPAPSSVAFGNGVQGSGINPPRVGARTTPQNQSTQAYPGVMQSSMPIGQATHAEKMFMSLVADRSKEKYFHPQNTPSTFSLPANLSTDVSPVRDLSTPGSNQSPSGSHAAGGGAGAGGSGGGGGGGGKGGSGGGGKGNGDKKKTKVMTGISAGDEEEREERQYKERSCTALHVIPWDQRALVPVRGFGMKKFSIFSEPLFWEKLDWTVRASLFTVLPLMILTLEPKTEHIFPMPSSVAFLAFWISMPTFGSGLREFFIMLKGYALSLLLLLFVIVVNPQAAWLILLFLFLFVLSTAFFAEELKRTCAYCLTVFLMERQAKPNETGLEFVKDYFITLLIALAFGLAAFFLPSIRWSSDLAEANVALLGNSLSIFVQGTCSSFWAHSPLERELHILRLRQLRITTKKAADKAEEFLAETEYEPHTSTHIERIKQRLALLTNIRNILSSMVQVVELVNDDPGRIDTPLCVSFGEAIEEELAIISSAMDSAILKISDFKNGVTEEDIQFFREARERFQDRLAEVRQHVVLNNEMYEVSDSDVLMGFFMFSVDELCEVISEFKPDIKGKSRVIAWFWSFLNDCKGPYEALRSLIDTIIHRRTLTRRAKEAIKLALCMTLPCIFQVYALDNSETSPVAGAAIIAFVYSSTGAQSFNYATNRVLGTVLGSLCALIAVQVADGRRLALYAAVGVISFLGAYVQTSKEYYAAGNAICNSVISVITQYKNPDAAMVRIQQNLFAILIYFCITMVLWPMRARKKVYMSFDISLRCFRESTCRLLRNLDMPEDVHEVDSTTMEALGQWRKKISRQASFLQGAAREPTLVGADFPEAAWGRLIDVQWQLWAVVSMMRFAYSTFMASKVDEETELSVHWVVLRRISPFAKELCDLLYAVVDLCLLTLNKTTLVPSAHLARLRHEMLETEKKITETYIQTLALKISGDDEEVMESSFDGGDSGEHDGSGTGGQGSDMHYPRNRRHSDKEVAPPRRKQRQTDGYFVYHVTEEEEELMRTYRNRSFNRRRLAQGSSKRGSSTNGDDNDTHEEDEDDDGGEKMSDQGRRSSSTVLENSLCEARANDKDEEGKKANKDRKKAEANDNGTGGRRSRVMNSIRHALGRKDPKPLDEADGDVKDESPSDKTLVKGRCGRTGSAVAATTEGGGTKPAPHDLQEGRKINKPEEDQSDGEELSIVHSQSAKSADDQDSFHERQKKGSQRRANKTRGDGLRRSGMANAARRRSVDSSDDNKDSTGTSLHADGAVPNFTFFDAKEKELVLSNRDIHSIEAFLFGVRALTMQLGDLQKALLEVMHSEEMEKKI